MNRAAIAAFVLVASIAVAAPAQAAESIDCIRQTVAPDVIAGFEDRIATGLIAGNENALAQDWSPLSPALVACRAKHEWSEAAANLATQFTLASIMKKAVERVIVKDGSDPVVLTALYRNLPIDVRRQFLDAATINAASQVFAQRMAARNISTTGNGNRHIGMLLGALALLEFRTGDFAAA